MSLEIAVVSDKFAVVVSDGLAWHGDTITDEHSRKQISLGDAIVVAAGGFCWQVEELLARCQWAYSTALQNGDDSLESVKHEFSDYIGQHKFKEFGATILGGLLVAKQPDGFLVIKQNGNRDHEEYLVKPGDSPRVAFLTPTGRIDALCSLAADQLIRNGDSPSQVGANLKALFHAAQQVENPRKLNTNLRIAVLGAELAGPECDPDNMLASFLGSFVEKMRVLNARPAEHPQQAADAVANNAITQGNTSTNTTGGSLPAGNTTLGQVALSANGGKVLVIAKVTLIGAGSPVTVTLSITGGGSAADSTGSFQIGTGAFEGISLMAVDTLPAASNTYSFNISTSAAGVSYNHMSIAAFNLKK